MKTIKDLVINEITINKSRFITVLCSVYTLDEVNERIKFYKKKYKDASHYCSAYILDSYMKCDDDGEPSGTAGIPILNVLKANDLHYVLCIVIRYFGGVKLGAGGLVRAYSNSVSKALDKASIAYLKDGYNVMITFDYENVKLIDNILKNVNVKKEFNEKIIYYFKIAVHDFENMENLLNEKVLIIKKEPILLVV